MNRRSNKPNSKSCIIDHCTVSVAILDMGQSQQKLQQMYGVCSKCNSAIIHWILTQKMLNYFSSKSTCNCGVIRVHSWRIFHTFAVIFAAIQDGARNRAMVYVIQWGNIVVFQQLCAIVHSIVDSFSRFCSVYHIFCQFYWLPMQFYRLPNW